MDRDALKKLSKDELVELVLKLQRPGLTSRTSSKPPSTDRKAKRSGSKPGGAKPGHKGHSRAPSEHPDQTFTHRPAECASCGQPFTANAQGEVIAEHETVDLPPIRPIVTLHQRLACTCGACGHRTKAAPLAQGSPFHCPAGHCGAMSREGAEYSGAGVVLEALSARLLPAVGAAILRRFRLEDQPGRAGQCAASQQAGA